MIVSTSHHKPKTCWSVVRWHQFGEYWRDITSFDLKHATCIVFGCTAFFLACDCQGLFELAASSHLRAIEGALVSNPSRQKHAQQSVRRHLRDAARQKHVLGSHRLDSKAGKEAVRRNTMPAGIGHIDTTHSAYAAAVNVAQPAELMSS
jgi:hypothetical protein